MNTINLSRIHYCTCKIKDKQNFHSCDKKSLLMNKSNYRHDTYFDPPKNTLDFRLRTCYNHAQESFVSKARLVVQPITFCQKQTMLNSNNKQLYPFKIVNETRKEHFNEATKTQHIGSHHFANSRHGYSRVVAGAMSTD